MREVDYLRAAIRKIDGERNLDAGALAEAILAEGYALVKLPEPYRDEDGGPDYYGEGKYLVDTTTGTSGQQPVLYANGESCDPAEFIRDAIARLTAGRAALAIETTRR